MPVKKPVNNEIAPNKMKIKLSYSLTLVLPFDKANTLLNTLEYAETVDDEDYNNHIIIPFKSDVTASIISNKEYLNMKADALLKGKKDA